MRPMIHIEEDKMSTPSNALHTKKQKTVTFGFLLFLIMKFISACLSNFQIVSFLVLS